MRQEINEHLQIIWLLARHASLKEFEKYSQQIQAINEQLGSLSMTGNHMLDAILWDKQSLARKMGLDFICQTESAPALTIHSHDLGFIVDNALDWALQTLQKNKGKVLYFQAKGQDDFYTILITNKQIKGNDLTDFQELQLKKDTLSLENENFIPNLKLIYELVLENKGLFFYKPPLSLSIQ